MPMLTCRSLSVGDLNEGLSLWPGCAGDEIVGPERARAAWCRVLSMRAFGGAVVETEPRVNGRRLVGIGAAVFVTQAFADQEVAEPQPGLNARIISSLEGGQPAVLSEHQLQAGNTQGGLDLVILCASIEQSVSSDSVAKIESLMAAALIQFFAGWRFRRPIREGVGSGALAHIESQRVFGSRDNFDNFHRERPENAWSRDRALFACTKEHALATPGSVASILFGYREPMLGLSYHEQELLGAAVAGLTDEEVTRTLGLKLPAVKKRWASAFDRIAAMKPDLLPEGLSNSGVRGPQKRHRLLNYIREHPEELKPVLRRRRVVL
jgi:hypothetical protein